MSQVQTKRGPSPKRVVIRDEQYRKHVASLPCLVCMAPKTQAAHISSGNYARGMKAGDDLCIPLCPTHHTRLDLNQGRYAEGVMGMTINELKAQARERYVAWKQQQRNA